MAFSHITPGDRVSIPWGLGSARRTGRYIEDLKGGWIRVELDQTGARVPSLGDAARRVTIDEELAEDPELRGLKATAAEADALGIPVIDHRTGERFPAKLPDVVQDPVVRAWTTLDPRVRKRIERASRALVVALDLHVEKDRRR